MRDKLQDRLDRKREERRTLMESGQALIADIRTLENHLTQVREKLLETAGAIAELELLTAEPPPVPPDEENESG